MRAKLDGNPIPELHWYKDGKILVSDRYTMKYSESNFAMLIIREAVEDDEGKMFFLINSAIVAADLFWGRGF